LFTGGVNQALPRAIEDTPDQKQVRNSFETRRNNFKSKNSRPDKKSRDWVLDKKERQRRQGKEVRPDTKYSGRKRPKAF